MGRRGGSSVSVNFKDHCRVVVLNFAVGSQSHIKSQKSERPPNRDRRDVIAARHGVVATGHGRCSQVGIDVLKEGGHAADAAVAASLCLGIVSPASSGIGGGAFMLLGRPPMLNTIAHYAIPSGLSGALCVHRKVEALKNAFALRRNLGDPDFVNITAVLSDMHPTNFAKAMKKDINDNRTYDPAPYGGRHRLEEITTAVVIQFVIQELEGAGKLIDVIDLRKGGFPAGFWDW